MSILDPGEIPSWPNNVNRDNWMHLSCRDVMDNTIENAPQLSHVVSALEWAAKLPKNSVLLIHCHAGISRSTAIAIAILVQSGWGIQKSVDYVKSMRRIMAPNPILTQYADDYLKMNGKLHQAAQDAVDYVNLLEKNK